MSNPREDPLRTIVSGYLASKPTIDHRSRPREAAQDVKLPGGTIPFIVYSRGSLSPTPNGKSEIGVKALANREHGVMPKSIGELKVYPFAFGRNSHDQVREASRDQR
jgi:hypothetical protein